MEIGFWGYPDPDVVKKIKNQYPNANWTDLDIDFSYPKTNILPEAYCKIIKNIIDNALYLKPDLIIAPIGKDKCDSGWFASKILMDLNFKVIQTIYENTDDKKEIKICTSDLPLIEKVTKITDNIIIQEEYSGLKQTEAEFGFWGVPPNDLNILKLFPNTTHLYGWIRCVEAGTPADIDLEMHVDENVPTVFYAQAFCAKSQLAKYLADKYNGLYIDIDDYASKSVIAKIEAFLRLR
ncbi:hypothetical protein IJO12_01995 [bacterium]|nr:hypothetical protein [bacterium]